MDHEVLVRQDILPGWRPTRPLTNAQYMSVRGEHAMTSDVSHFTGLPNFDFDLPLAKLAEAFGKPLPSEKGTGIVRGYWWGQVDDQGEFTGVWIVVHTGRVRPGGLAQVRYALTRPYSEGHGDGEQIMRRGVTDLVAWLKKR